MRQFLTAVAVLVCLSCFATVQYGEITAAQGALNSSKYTAVVDRGGWSHTLQNTMIFNNTSYLYASFTKGTANSYGAYYINGSQKGADIKLTFTADGFLTAVDSKGKPIAFTHGDAVGFWIEDVKGKTVYNTPGINHQQNYVGTAIINKNDYVIGFGNYGQYVNSAGGYSQVYNDASYVLDVRVSADHPTMGQPLPDVLPSLLIAALALAGLWLIKGRFAQKTA